MDLVRLLGDFTAPALAQMGFKAGMGCLSSVDDRHNGFREFKVALMWNSLNGTPLNSIRLGI